MTALTTRRAIDAIYRIESPRLIAGLTRLVRDVGHAEELAQDALVAALERWPTQGVPDNPGAWLMTTARNRALDELRRRQRLARQHEELGHAIEGAQSPPDPEAALDDDVGDSTGWHAMNT
ncbi:MAG: RNA polymerase subunit sigma-24, partial [Myxococcales bacterium]